MKALLLLVICGLAWPSCLAQTRTVVGSVTDEQGEPLPGTSVMVVGTSQQTIADGTGGFVIAANSGELLQLSFIGYESRVIQIGEETTLSLQMKPSVKMLDELVVVGYGSVPRSDVTGAVSKLTEGDFVKGNATAALQQAQGKIPGLVITQPGGDPNGDFNVRIRGATSLEGQPPLVVIDGVAIDDFDRAMATLNPNDIESYNVLKDASAAAIYGSRGANGVLLVTTKKGTPGNATIQYSGFGTVEKISSRFDVLNREQWLSATANIPNASYLDAGGDTDWQKEITRTAYTQSHLISAAGGSDHVRARGSVGYIDQQGLVINTGKQVLTTRLNTDLTSANGKLDVSFGVNTSMIDRDLLPDQTGTNQVRQGGAAVFTWASNFLPVWPVRDEEGNYYQPPATAPNPVFLLQELHSNLKQNFLQSSIRGDYEVIPSLKVGGTAAITSASDVYSRDWPGRIGVPEPAFATKSNATKRNYTGDLHFNFSKTFGAHHVSLTGVYEYNDFLNDGFSVNAFGQAVSGLWLSDNLSGASTTGDISSFKNEVRIISFLGRLLYNYNDRYLLTINFRRDGSSRFGPNSRWGNFPSAAVAWRISKERFMARTSGLDLKLRASYGLTGNQETLAPNSYQTLYGPAGAYYLNGTYGQSYGITREANPNLKWEVRKAFNVGVDFGFWNNRVSGTIDVFSDRTSDMLFDYNIPVPPFVTNRAYANAADATNKGIEAAVNATVMSRGNFRWNARANIGAVKNKITKLTGDFNGFNLTIVNSHYGWAGGGAFQWTPVTEIKTGYPIGVFWLPEHAGFDGNGNELFVNRDDEGNVTGSSTSFSDRDRIYIDPTPDYEWGLTNAFQYRHFDLTIFLRGVQGARVFANGYLNLASSAYLPGSNVVKDALINSFVHPPNISTHWLYDASFVRLENASLGYTVAGIKGISRLRFYVVGRNLWLLTKYKGIDPEVNVEGSQRYIDASYYPRARSFTVGVDVSF
ncbi:MAG: SusC/RagA family TonB-linked outer membrane protein [Chryseolinea sp.]